MKTVKVLNDTWILPDDIEDKVHTILLESSSEISIKELLTYLRSIGVKNIKFSGVKYKCFDAVIQALKILLNIK